MYYATSNCCISKIVCIPGLANYFMCLLWAANRNLCWLLLAEFGDNKWGLLSGEAISLNTDNNSLACRCKLSSCGSGWILPLPPNLWGLLSPTRTLLNTQALTTSRTWGLCRCFRADGSGRLCRQWKPPPGRVSQFSSSPSIWTAGDVLLVAPGSSRKMQGVEDQSRNSRMLSSCCRWRLSILPRKDEELCFQRCVCVVMVC